MSRSQWWRLRLRHVKRLSPSISPSDVGVTPAEVESALPQLNNNRSGAGQGWPAELIRYAYRELQDEDGKTLKFHVLERPLAAILGAAFQRGILPDDVKSSLVTPVFKCMKSS